VGSPGEHEQDGVELDKCALLLQVGLAWRCWRLQLNPQPVMPPQQQFDDAAGCRGRLAS
jgi:hypothetical protein